MFILFRKTKKQKFVIKKDYRNLNEKFLKKFGFKFKATLEDQMEIWIWEK